MLLTITNTKAPATDLGYLLHKNPNRVQSFELSFGKVHVFYPRRQPTAVPLRFFWTLTQWVSCGLGVDRPARVGCSINT
jgi:RNA repair, ligase-Pnkp-associating, region of Hen1